LGALLEQRQLAAAADHREMVLVLREGEGFDRRDGGLVGIEAAGVQQVQPV